MATLFAHAAGASGPAQSTRLSCGKTRSSASTVCEEPDVQNAQPSEMHSSMDAGSMAISRVPRKACGDTREARATLR